MAASLCSRFFFQTSKQRVIFTSTIPSTFTSPFLCRGHRLGQSDDELYQRTSVSIMKKEQGSGPMIQSYSSRGFNIDGNRVFGPCAVLPPAILQWKVGSHTDITEESVSLFHMIEPRIEILVLGTGAKVERIDPSVLALLKKKGISVEVQDTPNACATFNFLTSERRVAALVNSSTIEHSPGCNKGVTVEGQRTERTLFILVETNLLLFYFEILHIRTNDADTA
ncbi:hypothetical protein WMY93_012411 [Mugilogobius chulae]|uniref:NADH dehydrogenase [ubiquinone] 1 alpha subcomplex assembly factor 3 n=1 Tax=Mugilogobius chulae TaxID=88201 RepID=A0AAW0P6K8_9GOBI